MAHAFLVDEQRDIGTRLLQLLADEGCEILGAMWLRPQAVGYWYF